VKRYIYQDRIYTVKELSEISGIAQHTLRDRLRRGYTVEQAVKLTPTRESVEHFREASYWKDWLGMSTTDLYEIYWRWCIQHGYPAVQKQGFTRHIMQAYPQLKVIPTRRGDKCYRIIRMRG